MQMPSGLSARVVAVCTLVVGVSIAHAQRRPVVVVDLSGDTPTGDLARDLNPVLVSHPELQPIPDSKMASELYGEFMEDDRDNIKDAGLSKGLAEDALAGFNLPDAQRHAGDGQEKLQQVVPSVAAVPRLYSQLAFIRGQALLGIPRDAPEAPKQFALAHRLDPSFVPDAARYLPDVVQAFENAKKKWPGKGTLVVAGRGRLWIDGREVGSAPAEIEVDEGPHVVWLTGGERMTSANTIVVEAAPKKTKLDLGDAPADIKTKLRRARAALRNAPDPAARAAAMKQLADLIGVRDALLLKSVNGNLVYQTWCDGACPEKPGFSKLEEVKKKKPVELLEGLAPPKAKIETPKIEKPKPIVDERRWYQRRPVQVTIGIGIIAAVISGYYLYRAATDDSVTWDNDITPAGRIQW